MASHLTQALFVCRLQTTNTSNCMRLLPLASQNLLHVLWPSLLRLPFFPTELACFLFYNVRLCFSAVASSSGVFFLQVAASLIRRLHEMSTECDLFLWVYHWLLYVTLYHRHDSSANLSLVLRHWLSACCWTNELLSIYSRRSLQNDSERQRRKYNKNFKRSKWVSSNMTE